MIRNDLIFRRLCLLPEDVSAGRDGKIDCAAADSGVDEMNDLIFRRLSLPPEDDSAAFGLDDLIFRRRSFPPGEFAAGGNTAADACDAMKIAVMIFHRTNLPPHEFSAGWNGDYIWPDLWTEPSVCNQPVTRFSDLPIDLNGGQHSLFAGASTVAGTLSQYRVDTTGACVLLSFRGVIFVPRWLAEHLMTWTCLSTLFCIVAFSDMCLPSGTVMIWS